VFNGKKFDQANLKVFGAKIHIHIPKIKGEVNQRQKSLPPPPCKSFATQHTPINVPTNMIKEHIGAKEIHWNKI
jgi:hypothetical protein